MNGPAIEPLKYSNDKMEENVMCDEDIEDFLEETTVHVQSEGVEFSLSGMFWILIAFNNPDLLLEANTLMHSAVDISSDHEEHKNKWFLWASESVSAM